MNWKDHEAHIDERILQEIDLSREALYEFKSILGHEYIKQFAPEDQYLAYRDSRSFWNWLRQVFLSINIEILDYIGRTRQQYPYYQMHRNEYIDEVSECIYDFKPNNEVRTVVIEAYIKEKALTHAR